MKKNLIYLLLMSLTIASCNEQEKQTQPAEGTFGYDKAFILKHDSSAVTLGTGDAKVLVSAKYQAKVFTSTAAGDTGKSFGWIHYAAFDKPIDPHMNAYGGENRFWLGPEGGQYSLFFAKGTEQKFDNWHTPSAYDSESWNLQQHDSTSATFTKSMVLKNYAGTLFSLKVERQIKVLHQQVIDSLLGLTVAKDVKSVAYRTENIVTNAGPYGWNEKTGMPCTWILDMFPPSDQTTVVIPFKKGKDSPVTSDYFGPIPPNRLKLTDSVLFFKADGKSRGKLGVHPSRAKDVAGSYDAIHHILTIMLYDLYPHGQYLNQEWRTDKDPYSGDAMNAYNDGPLATGGQLGPFYELESVAPAYMLAPGTAASHWHTVMHFTGSEKDLNAITEKVLGVSIEEIKKAL